MHKEKSNSSSLTLKIPELDCSLQIRDFDGCSGTLVKKIDNLPSKHTYQAEICANEQSKPIWFGDIRLQSNDSSIFNLLIRANGEHSSDLNWSALPKVLSVFDGGYRPLLKEEAERLLTDLIDFHHLIKCKVHYQTNGNENYFDAVFTQQENLKTLTEVLVQIVDSSPDLALAEVEIFVLELELFETTFFLVTVLEEQEDDLLIFRLTNHFYGNTKREGRRIHLGNRDIKIPEGRLLEVSDFGVKIETQLTPFELGTSVSLTIGEAKLRFLCIFSANNTAGLKLIDHSTAARKYWQSFLLPFQYPNLIARNPNLHETTWNLFGEAGYFKLPNGVGELVENNREVVFQEWNRVDSIGPDEGTTVIANNNGSSIGTIGVNRVNHGIWLSQALATSKDPRYIDHTRSLYAWRSRVIIQQNDGQWNLAFFSAKKAFLDRFFRKFLLLLREDESHLASWEEKHHYYLLPAAGLETGPRAEIKPTKCTSKFLQEFSNFETSAVQMQHLGKSLALFSPPHLSLAQMLTSLWAENFNSTDVSEFAKIASENGHSFASLFFDNPIENGNPETEEYRTVGGQPFVVWMCARSLFPKFLANSLRAFELMHTKYGSQEVA
jgi:hypothetical protein